MKIIVFIFSLFVILPVKSQPTVKVEVSSDTIAIGQIVDVTYTIENGQGKFNVPDMTGLPVISGPNTSSSFMYQNGQMNSSQSYSFSLRPLEPGNLMIPKTTYQHNDDILTIQPVEIVVLGDKKKQTSPKSITETPSSKPTREKRKF